MLIDTHCHLDFPDFDKDREEVIARAKEAGIKYFINISSDYSSNLKSLEFAHHYPEFYTSLGIHPHYAQDVDENILKRIRELAKGNGKVVAIGEIGLDFYRNISPREIQLEIFKQFLELAEELKLPIIVHNRNADEEILGLIKKFSLKGVFHCFSGDREFLREVLHLGFYVSFTANITYPKAKNLRAIVSETPVEKIILETDSPFLPPQGKRGLRNEPAYLVYLVKELAKLKCLTEEDIFRITSLNACQLFKLPFEETKPKIAYPIRNSLYLNITNRCTDNCSFCVRFYTDYVKGHNLRLAQEPDFEEIVRELNDISKYREVVFCGYGEPLLRLEIVKKVAKYLKEKNAYVRLNTNGQGNLIYKRNIVPELKGLIDEVSVSLNVDTEENYHKICQPQFGAGTFSKVKEFVLECKKYIPSVSVTFIDLPEVDLNKCAGIAQELGVKFRIRRLGQVG
ncbi:MAG: YchF/TatD family DNA exonuclease [Candidatus Omnitrophica bacterium]|nr:YchF/TatD family DNA exonuclease [Candidatus Omnitrophota bacterium]MCM8794017.1 YchF/TatD family DNA exonuclease [Candidatus Omnitrophota bacterium]